MVDFAELNKRRARADAFRATELGKLFWAHHNALIAYWRNDANENISDKRLRELDEASRKADRALLDRLMEIANV